jgi:putative ABC transport system ATP-binding protein
LLLRLTSVSKSYPRREGTKLALDCVSLEVPRGELIGVFGPSGAGKTTLLRIAAGLLDPDNGVVTCNGERLDRMPRVERQRFLRREVSCIWADEPAQERMAVLDHVALPLYVDGRHHRAATRRAREALATCQVEDCLGMEMQDLSAGERQRVDVAQALVSEPSLLLADAATSRLSIVEQETIMVILTRLAHDGNVGVLLTNAHSHALLGVDSTFYLRDGKLLEDPWEEGESGKVYRLPTAGSRRAAADA